MSACSHSLIVYQLPRAPCPQIKMLPKKRKEKKRKPTMRYLKTRVIYFHRFTGQLTDLEWAWLDHTASMDGCLGLKFTFRRSSSCGEDRAGSTGRQAPTCKRASGLFLHHVC